MAVVEIRKGVNLVGVRDWSKKIFDALIPLPLGTSYNSYLVKGSAKTALIDTVNADFAGELMRNIGETAQKELDYLVMNHAEPDHAGSIPAIMEAAPQAVLVATPKGVDMARLYFHVSADRTRAVKDGDTIDLGGKTLQFIEAPFLHWPETMFTYIKEDKILCPCDFMGFHTAEALYDDEVEEFTALAKAYFGEIMMPYARMGAKALDKIKDLPIDVIAPSHGPIHRNPRRILECYRKWTAGETVEKAILVYVTMWSSTEKMIRAMADALIGEGIEVRVHNLAAADIGTIAKDLVDSRAIVLGAPTVLGGMHPLGIYGANLVKMLRPPAKYAVALSSYGWGGGAIKQAAEILGPTKIEIVGAHEVKGPPSADDLAKVAEIGRTLAARIKAG
ncbi:MAG TPA: FprA family A-type flavoprotein [bacterium]|nr:FprA family A-type flavoprotein [bacterium]